MNPPNVSTFPIVTLFYGTPAQRAAYAPLLFKWLEHHRAKGLGDRLVVITRAGEEPFNRGLAKVIEADVSNYADIIRPGHPFDVKGALMCEALRLIRGDFLFLDNDAFLVREPRAELIPPAGTLMAMARDIGAINAGHEPLLEAPFGEVRKLCAGVAWFGAATAKRRESLISQYAKAWHELRDGGGQPGRVPWEPQLVHLLEQYAWSLAAHRLAQPVLRDRWNWPAHIAQFGPSRISIVHHEFGHGKWRRLGIPAPERV